MLLPVGIRIPVESCLCQKAAGLGRAVAVNGGIACRLPDGLFQNGSAVRHCLPAVKSGRDRDSVGIAGLDAALCADVQAGCGHQHHQHRGQQNADGGQTCAVAPHPEHHGGHGDKVVCLVIVFLVLFQQLAQHHGACQEQGIGGKNDQKNRYKEPDQGRQRLLNGNGQIVGVSQQDDARQGLHPEKFGHPLAHAGGFDQLQGLCSAHPDQGVEQKQQKNAAVDQNRDDHGLRAEPNFVINGLVQQIHQRQFRRLAHGNAKKKAAQQGDERHIEVFPEEHPADVPFVHAQHIIKAEFLVALPDQEGIGIEQKQQ